MSSRKLVIERAMFARRSASAPLIRARSRPSGSKRRRPAESCLPRPPSPSAPPCEQQLQVGAGVAVERGEDLVGLDVGLGLRERDRRALLDRLARRVPGSSSIVMSWRPVRGRSSTVASSWISSAYSLLDRIVTTARPSSSSTSVMSPTLTPAMFTVWPWPGVTACAVSNSALSSKRSSPRNGIQDG